MLHQQKVYAPLVLEIQQYSYSGGGFVAVQWKLIVKQKEIGYNVKKGI